MHVLGEPHAWAWPPVGEVDEPARTPLWLIRTLAAALASEDQTSLEHQQHVARQIARTAEELERSLADAR
ncbi:hypothetical protein OJ997_25885 [Solirubrobacter phytolaccae]|uniref:Uncharacterized protein n=1 Tax=Solirubrobacter phytolaccae TaxID=1404360 RepID=A0A9X3NF09_9ACTN|nr:hypothetical protein [Solirubrobacter phytolaccae]MDA0183765.1 hypothetical protein [Solirubrobacter phytolaccae]